MRPEARSDTPPPRPTPFSREGDADFLVVGHLLLDLAESEPEGNPRRRYIAHAWRAYRLHRRISRRRRGAAHFDVEASRLWVRLQRAAPESRIDPEELRGASA